MKKEPANWIGLLLILAIVAVIALALHAAR